MGRLRVGGDESSVIRLWGDKVERESFARGDCNLGGSLEEVVWKPRAVKTS